MKEKIGIITVHNNTNYGANLQAFASSTYLIKSGYDARIIDYTLPSHLKHTHLFSWLKSSWDGEPSKSIVRKAKLGIALTMSAPWKHKRLKSFASFRNKYIRMTPRCKDTKDIENLNLDTIVCGSDQIWNPVITEGVNPIFFGAIDGVKKRISYAASVGSDKYEDGDEEKVSALIKALDYCSVREVQTGEYLSRLVGVDVETVCDPVFLIDKEDYNKIAAKRKIKDKYVLLYSVIHDEEMTRVAQKYASDKGIQLVEICASPERRATHKQIATYGPSEFLSAFKYADAVITNSFHGTAFSIIFEKNFYIFDNKHGGSRITNLLEKAELSERLVSSVIKCEHPSINYTAIKDNLKDYVALSKRFLDNALKSEKIELADKNCVGCGACMSVCTKGAIKLSRNKEGFLESYIDIGKCVKCSLCEKVCPALNHVDKLEVTDRVIAFKADDDVRKNSTSGGAFAALALSIIKEGGAFYGASLTDSFKVQHIRGTNETDLRKIQGTKYLQSDISGCYESLSNDLKEGRIVLFSGTPCQIDAVNRYVNIKKLPRDKFITVDIICHGVPSAKIYEDYLVRLEKEYGSVVKTYKFRSKNISWRGNSCMATLADGREIKNEKKLNGFMNLYYSDNITRESCYSCKYTSKERVSDITISDYWGIENVNSAFEDSLGVSMILLNTDKGRVLFDKAEGQRTDGSFDGIKQPQLLAPTKCPDTRMSFWNEYEEKGLTPLLKTYGGVRRDSLKQIVYNIVKGRR